MKKTKKALASLAITGMALTMVPFNAFATGTVPTRLAGTTAAQTAVAIADQTGWTGTAILASSASYGMVDALTSGPLAKFLKAPILLQEPGAVLNADTQAELTKLAVKTVYVTSGTAVISQAVLDQLTGMGITVESLGGADRFATSVNIANKMVSLGATVSKAAVAYGWLNQDALSIASIASAQTEPILLTEKNSIPASVEAFLTTNTSVKTTDVIGGTGVISDAVISQLPSATRQYGNTAYDTNVAVLKAFDSVLKYDHVFIANGETAIDALAGAPLAAIYNAGIVLTNGTANEGTAYVASKLSATSIVTALGGTAVVPDVVSTGVVYVEPVTPTTPVVPVTPVSGGSSGGSTTSSSSGGSTITFTATTDSTTTNAAITLGLKGTSVTSSAIGVAKATISADTGKIDITSVSAGTAIITVTDALSHIATIPVTVANDGTITIGTITKYVASVVPITPPAPTVTNDDILNTVTGMETGMEYNLDGTGYVAYDVTTFGAIDFSGNHTLLVRIAAEGINPFGPDTTLTFTTNTASALVDAVAPVIATPLADQTTTGTAITLDSTATVGDGGTLSYQWYQATDAITTGTAIALATIATYNPPVDTAGTFYYYCVVTNTNDTATGSTTATTASKVATVTATTPAAISIPAITGVTAPVTGEVPVTTLAATSEYTATITWSPTISTTFAAITAYTATITLTPKTGFTLTGVAENFFTVAGATVINTTGSGIVMATFPATVVDVTPPILSAVTLGPILIGDNVVATSNEDGFLYLVPLATTTTPGAIDAAGLAANGTKVAATSAVSANLSTTDFAAGDYVVYAIDAAGNASTSSAAITINMAAATTPSAIVLAASSTAPVGGVTNVAIPAAGATDTTGAITGWSATADTIKFTVADVTPAVSTITINGNPYTSGADYTITAAAPLTIVVTTTEAGKVTSVRTFTVTVS